jgi:hypothetical protein
MVLRILWCPGVFLLRARVSSDGNALPSSERAICAGVPDILPLGIPPDSVGRGCGQVVGPGFVVDSV